MEKAVGTKKDVILGNGDTIEVKKLPLGDYAQLMLALKKLPNGVMSELSDIDTENEEQMFQAMFGLFGEAWGQVIEIISIGSGIDKDTLANDPEIGLDGGVELFLAIYEVNNLQKVIGQVKNVMNRPTK
ncbi:hypothetical protein [Halobacillus ihumii]|uniref:hypothetical protein n=1 Tax=Halobacillus ihumii TaxID=2686092 RepID=UPI0013D7041D|nr:hypothetical protein [Halobacillus ihumii]